MFDTFPIDILADKSVSKENLLNDASIDIWADSVYNELKLIYNKQNIKYTN